MKRLPQIQGEWLDRSATVGFEFEGQTYSGFAGDTISSALWASGRHVLARSFKYHRPRGVLSLANHDANVIVQNGGEPNVRADVTPIAAGMKLAAVNTFGGLDGDRGSLLGSMSRFLPVGFYYKAFHTKRLFPLWERMFRAMTGLGKVDFDTPRLRTPKRYDFCDVLVIGAGPSGLAAALAAAEQGAKVVVVDENAKAGGSGGYQLGAEPARRDVTADLLTRVEAHPAIRLMTGTLAAGYYADHWVPLVRDGYMIKMRARAVVVAAGAFEQPAVFRNNDLPGVMLASAAQRLVYRYAVQPMQRAVVLTANADGYRAALDLAANGVTVAAVIDLRADHQAGGLEAAVRAKGIAVNGRSCILEALPTGDGKGVAAARVTVLGADGQPDMRKTRDIQCDGIVMSVGWAPAANLLYQAGTRMRYASEVEQFVPDVLPEGVFACGRVNGVFALDGKLLDGSRAGSAAAAHAGCGSAAEVAVPAEAESPSHPWPVVSHPDGKNFVDFDEDLQLKDFENAAQEGFDNIELLKRYSTNGMGPSQGKHSNMNGLRILARLTGKLPQQVGTTTARPFFHPVPMSVLAGRGFNPERRTPLTDRHDALGAKWMPAGVWQRPEFYQVAGKDRQACIHEEVAAVRNGVGLIDVGTLGKLEVIGPQAAEFLERVYVSRYANLKVGMTRYALMCDESGVLMDDGVVARLADEHFYFTTTTSGAATIYRELSRLNTMWRLDCGIVNHTGAFAAVNLAGPKSREVLAGLTDVDLSPAAFPYLAVREGSVAVSGGKVPARLMRVGFVGELGYEIHVPAEHGPALWDALMAAGADEGIRPFGVEAQRLLRLEKGHIIIGQDTDGLTTPFEAACDWAVKLDKPFFVGQRSLMAEARRQPRQKLVGFMLAENFTGTAPKECHLVIEAGDIAGRVTSIAWSPNLQRHIGMAYVQPAMATVGRKLSIRLSGGDLVEATVCPTPFYDPENLRQKLGSDVAAQSVAGGRGADEVARGACSDGLRNSLDAQREIDRSSRSDSPRPSPQTPRSTGGVGAVAVETVFGVERFGLKGPGASGFLAALGLPVPAAPNSWLALAEGGFVLRLGLTEYLVEGPASLVSRLRAAPVPSGMYPVLRQDTALCISGQRIHELLLQVCSVDFGSLDLSTLPVVLTSMAGVGVTVLPGVLDGVPTYRLWCDGTYGEYLFETLAGIAEELGGSFAAHATRQPSGGVLVEAGEDCPSERND